MVVWPSAPFGLGRNGLVQIIFSPCCPLNEHLWAARSLSKIGRLFSLFLLSCPTLALLRLFILLLMSGDVHPNPGPIFPCSVCAGNVTWRGKSVQCCACSKWVHLGCSQLSLSQFRALGSSHSWSCLPCRITVTPSSDASDMYTSTVQSSLASANAALLPHPRLQTSYPPSDHSISSPSTPTPPSLAHGFSLAPPASTPPPDSLRVLQWNAEGLRARSTELLHFLLSHPVDLICIQESNLNSSFQIPGFSGLRSDRSHSRSGIFSSDTTHASGSVVIFVRQGSSFSELSTSSLSSLDPYSDYVETNISLNNSSSLSFLNVYAPLFAPPQRMAEPTPPSILPSYRNLFILGDFNCHHPLWDSIGISDPRGEEVFDWVISSDVLPLNDPDAPTLLHRSSGSRSSPDISFAPSSLALSCSWEVLQDLGSDHLPILLTIPLSPVFRPNERPPSFNFQKARWDGFAYYFDSHCPSAEGYSSLSSAAAFFTSLTLNAAKSSIPFGRIKRPPKAWWSAEVEEAVSEKRKAFAAAHRSHEDRQSYISASRRASSVTAKAKTEAWQTNCSSLSSKSVHSLLRSIAGSPSSSSSSPNCSSPRESASVYAAYLRSHFSVSQPKALRSRARGYLSELRRATCSEESYSSFCSPFSLAEFHAVASNLSSSSATGPDKVTYPMLKHLPRFGMDFFLHIFHLSWSLHSFPSMWKTSSVIPIHKMGKPLDSPAFFRPISLKSCVSKLFERIILSRLLFFLESNSILSSRQAGFRPGRSTLNQILYLSQSILDGFNKPRPGSRTILSTIDFSKAFDSVWLPALFHKPIRLASLLALLDGLNLSFLIGALVWFFKITKAVPFESVKVFRKDPFLALYFSLFSLMIFWPLCLFPSAALFTMTIWPFGPPPPRSLLRWRPHKELCFDWSAGVSTGVFL